MKMKTTYLFAIVTLFGVIYSSNAQAQNTFSGQDAGANNTGNYNTGFGQNSLSNNSSNSNNAFGHGTLSFATGGFNSAFGNEALALNLNGTLNSAFGTRSLANNLSGAGNVALGHRTLEGNVIGNFNTAIGYGALLKNIGAGNIAIGANTPRSLISGDNNIFIGTSTANYLTNGSGNVFLGQISVSKLPSTAFLAGSNTNNTVIIADGAGTQRIFVHGNGNTGIGLGNNVIPTNKLDVKGGVAIGRNFTPNGVTPSFIAPTNGLIVEGRMGLGTATPNNKLEIKHGVNGNSGLRFTNLNSSYNPPTYESNTKFLSVNATGDVVLQNMSNNAVESNELSSIANVMRSNVNGISDTANIVNSISNTINTNNQLITTVNGVASNPVNLPLQELTEIDGSTTNELQTISQSGNTITLSNGGGSITLPTFVDTDSQSLSLTGNTLSISNGNSVVLPTVTPQTLSQSGNTVTLSNGGGSFNLPTFTATPQTISQSGNTVTLSNGGGTFTLPTTSVVAGTNVTVTGNGSAATPFQVSSLDKSIYADNGTINQATTINSNRIVYMNNSNIWFNGSSSESNGKIYVGSTATYPNVTGNYRMFVEGGILTEKVKVALRSSANWADYVFEKDYNLMPLKKVEEYINTNKHLPGIASAAELAKNGLDLAEMQAKHMQKIEELTLYIIEQNKAIEKNIKAIEELKSQVKVLTANQD
jgi:hypothetical protein